MGFRARLKLDQLKSFLEQVEFVVRSGHFLYHQPVPRHPLRGGRVRLGTLSFKRMMSAGAEVC